MKKLNLNILFFAFFFLTSLLLSTQKVSAQKGVPNVYAFNDVYNNQYDNQYNNYEAINTNASVQVFESLESEFLKLRNLDTKVERIKEWETLARKFEVFFDKNERLSQSAVAMHNASILYEELYKKTHLEKYLDRAFIVIDKFLKDYKNHYLADDIIVKKGDIYLFLLNDFDKAKKCYEEVVKNYVDSDMFELAKARVKLILDRKNSNVLGTVSEQVKNNGGEDKFTNNNYVIVIDPGHGGEEVGAKNAAGLLEKDITLDIALKLEKILKRNTGFNVFLTRSTDKFLSLGERTEFANEKEADLFLSLHVNASVKRDAYGIETYYLDNTDDKSSRKLAERENKSLTFGNGDIDDLQFMISDLIQSGKQEESIVFANHVQSELIRHLNKKWRGIKDLGVKKAPFYILVGAHMPCVLTEILFIDNYQDAKKLANERFRHDVAHALYVAILKYFNQK
ncbi:MAG: N-acetylmuramoyl-L-alanine amidase [Bdellovibrionota bacterium]